MARVPLPPLARHFQAIVIVFSNDGGTNDREYTMAHRQATSRFLFVAFSIIPVIQRHGP